MGPNDVVRNHVIRNDVVRIEHNNVRIDILLATSLLISVLLTVLLNLLTRR